jgi:glutaryl-CoA dehydrogenase
MTAIASGSALDLLDFDSALEEDERHIRDAVRRFVEREVLDEVAQWFEDGASVPPEVIATVADLGLLGMHLEGYGCAGTNAVSYGLACMELEAGDSGLRSFVSVQGSLAMFPIWRYGSEEQKQAWLPRMAAGEVIGCFGLTEHDAGSDPGAMRTRARRDGSDWVIDGAKMWITNGAIADIAVVWAATDEGIRGFIVPTSSPGFTANNVPPKLSLRASVTSELVLESVRVPAEALLPGAEGLRAPLSCLSEARFGIVWGAVGAARACIESALQFATTRTIFDRPLTSFQLTQEKLANMTLELEKARLLALRLGRLKDAGQITPAQISLGKLNNVREALRIAREARGILGAPGITLEYPVMRHMVNLESVYTYEGTNEIHTLIVGQAITGESAFR